jgi:hypothetical protein
MPCIVSLLWCAGQRHRKDAARLRTVLGLSCSLSGWPECEGTGGCATAAAVQGCVLAWKAVLLYHAVTDGNTLFCLGLVWCLKGRTSST